MTDEQIIFETQRKFFSNDISEEDKKRLNFLIYEENHPTQIDIPRRDK